jgi:hypothetical protein
VGLCRRRGKVGDLISSRSGSVADAYSAKIENSILCSNVRIGAKSQVKDCEFGTGFEAKAEGESGPDGHEHRLTISEFEGREIDRWTGSIIDHCTCIGFDCSHVHVQGLAGAYHVDAPPL